MKAYVIKNKELYKTTNARLWTKDIRKCANWDTFAKAKQYLKGCYLNNMKDCEVVEITIAETDLERKVKELQKHIIEFINELAWEDVKYDAMQSTMGEFTGSPSAVPRYAKKYFDLWKEMFGEELRDE